MTDTTTSGAPEATKGKYDTLAEVLAARNFGGGVEGSSPTIDPELDHGEDPMVASLREMVALEDQGGVSDVAGSVPTITDDSTATPATPATPVVEAVDTTEGDEPTVGGTETAAPGTSASTTEPTAPVTETPAAAPPAATPPAAPTQDEIRSYLDGLYGRPVSLPEIQGVMGFATKVAQLPMAQQQAIADILEGRVPSTPATTTPVTQAPPSPIVLPDDLADDPVAQLLLQQQQQLAALQAAQQAQAQTEAMRQVAVERQRAVETIEATRDAWRGVHPELDDTAVVELETWMVQQQVLPQFVAAAGGDVGVGTARALEWAATAHPETAARIQQNVIDVKVTERLAEEKATEQRRVKAASLSGDGQQAPRGGATIPTRRTNNDPMANDLRALMGG